MTVATAAETTIRCRQLVHRFDVGVDVRPVLEGIDLDVAPGEIVLLTGPSGSGKTTLLTLFGGLRQVQEGELEVCGARLRGMSQRALVRHRRSIGFIFQLHNLFPALSALHNVRMSLELTGLSEREQTARARGLLERLGLGERADYKPHLLSGGQRQRVAVARALAPGPALILADEPTAALDRESGQEVMNLLRERAQAGASVVIVTHDPRVRDSADRIVNLVDGRLVSDLRLAAAAARCELLRSVHVFRQHSPAELLEIAQSLEPRREEPGGEVVRQGEPGERFYLIEAGRVEVLRDGARVAELAAGEFFGEQALLNDAPRNATVRALEAVSLLTLDAAAFRAALARSPSFEEELRRASSLRGTS
ncbi:MAG: ATP-binding cassette domain-containing protein [Planctomycetota bacterium]